MTNVSKKPLAPTTRRKLLNQFSKVFKSAGDAKMSNMFSELFTEAEQVMFIKRLGIIILLSQGLSNYAVAKYLEVSEATVRSTKEKYNHGEYETIVRVLRNKKFNSEKFWRVVELMLTAGLPPRIGRGRWEFLQKHK
jgi:hypothetical protein